ncbi:MAG TPA: hypothetical protein PKA64_14655 [Myxococcota bacterium]|nr:hypothetical protein [Myxococcota bacterium]
MNADGQTMVYAALAGLFCLLAVLMLAGLAVYNMRRARPAPAPAPPPPAPSRPPGLDIFVPGPGASGDGAFEEEEMPTVVVNQPDRPAMAGMKPPAGAPQRSSGATIIAFDEEEEEDGG